ncbi:acyltransferase family protein [Alteromonas gilva]|uniref:Acyltransferase n=1 Tax=Alteromonas gilva TaxID=2987522 RepID=A0ABT5L3B8_9ALTE|nr:acyltransferase [Alteromonas gilva]MDC8830347.1 acyltransferase [Alteromonas gilva]
MKANLTKNHIRGLDSLRGLMALWVAIAHTLMTFDIYVPAELARVFNVAYAVDVFMILSGFVIFLLLDTQRESFNAFIVRRAYRLFPVYLIALAISALTINWQIEVWSNLDSSGAYYNGRLATLEESSNHYWPHLLTHLVLLQGLFSELLTYSDFTFIEPAWSLTLEWQFYLVVPFIFYSLISSSKQYRLLVIAAILASTYGSFGSGFLANNIHFFIVGMASYYLYKNIDKIGFTHLPLVCLCIALVLRNIPMTIWFVCLYGLLSQNWFGSILQMVLHRRILIYVGKTSYPIYVIHTLCIYPCLLLSAALFPDSAPLFVSFAVLSTLCLTVVLSSVLHHLVEVPMIRWGKAVSGRFNKHSNI